MRIVFRILTVLVVSGVLLYGSSVSAQEEMMGLGDIGFDPVEYQANLKAFPDMHAAALPSSLDWRNYGVVTPPKNQGSCGSCWAFATAGVMESKILLAGGPEYDLSEEQQVSCNLSLYGCCGGNYYALQFWYTENPKEESCTGYDDYSTGCPTESDVPCESLDGCSAVPYYTTGMFTVNTNNFTEVKTSLQQDGPAYFRYGVYSDFYDYWSSGSPGEVYTQATGSYLGGHAVLMIGWDDTKQAWLCKNSWGATGGPNNDGTFWIARSGHANGLSFGMANADLVAPPLTQINLSTPANLSTVASTPTFEWTTDGGSNNIFAVDFALSPTGPVYSTYEHMRISVNQSNWTMPGTIWTLIPSGHQVYWRVRGADLDASPISVITSGEVRSFYKQ